MNPSSDWAPVDHDQGVEYSAGVYVDQGDMEWPSDARSATNQYDEMNQSRRGNLQLHRTHPEILQEVGQDITTATFGILQEGTKQV